jgi:hypothetical protein
MTPVLPHGIAVAAVAAALLSAASVPAFAATYCVEREPDVVLGHRVHDGVARCVPGP